ncbi:hypothetical protein BHE74_00025921 [Ensete ventricosum]|uniref:Uncharacterized protein n=1 Tax=Ensete ventricosum TaxID=4639 RepID=A0A444G610_ENSVE|nr:hypothetical protein GW17_00005167 [Ensete ventricosum]RWW66697.1 hypothetical protein BHE74_00025921 [Ensete ventricosum]RZR72996.1 hypothetical protein BHM03_00019048 [Ensete ventricosum]
MLPWLLIPLLLFWAMSPFLPPGLRFEITSPRLACVMVLLVTLFWYEILMPQLSLWRTRRSARLRERRRALAIEMQKLKKTATRRCRNCHTPYRDQNPGGGRFMCSYCGHVSKRPVLDLPRSVGSSGVNDLVGKNGWMCSQDWSAEGSRNWANPLPHYWPSDDQCSMEKSCSGVVLFPCKLLFCFFTWLFRKVFGFGSREDGSDADQSGPSSKRGESGGNLQESRWEKARRKAEEKRQAKLEKEMLEEEERKQREEVARLVEERRRIRDEMLKTEKEHSESSVAHRERDNRKVAERGRPERKKDKDKGSSKSNSDVEDLDKRINRESERKREFEKRNETERRDSLKTTDIHKSHTSGALHGNKVTISSLVAESVPSSKDAGTSSIADEIELFEDPCYVPDPISLLGPVSESLDNFPLDLGAGFLSSDKVEKPQVIGILSGDKVQEPQVIKNISAPRNISKPSPIESPISRLRVSDEKQTAFGQLSCNSKSQDSHPTVVDESQGTWQMWGTPLAHDGLGLGGPSSWLLPIGQKNLKPEDTLYPFPHNPMTSFIAKESPTLLGMQAPQHVYDGNQQNGGTYNFHGVGINGSDHCLQKSPFQSLPVDAKSNLLPIGLVDNMQHIAPRHNSPKSSSADSPFEPAPANSWFR